MVRFANHFLLITVQLKQMKYILSFLCLLLGTTAFAQTSVQTLTHDDVTRSYRVHLPPNFDAAESVPVVLNFHGIGSNALEQELYSQFNNVSDSAGFIVVYPEGLVDTLADGDVIRHWNTYFGSDSDDLGFTNTLIDSLHADYNIDLSRVYSTGMSNGGFMSYMLACELSHRIAAIASVTGAMTFIQQENCSPSHQIPVMQIHGTDDSTVPYDGSLGFYPSIAEGVNYWVDFNNCDSTATNIVIPNSNTSDNSTAALDIWGGCSDDSEVQFYTIEGGTHTWPGTFNFIGNVTNQDFKASGVVWNFFNRFEHPNPTAEAPVDTMVIDTTGMNIDTTDMMTDTTGMNNDTTGMVIDTTDMMNDTTDMVIDTTGMNTDTVVAFIENLAIDVHIFPNPINDVLSISANSIVYKTSLMDVNGTVLREHLWKPLEKETKMNTGDLPTGLYFIQIETDAGVLIKKVLKN